MKFYDTHFDDYIVSNTKENLHPKLEKTFSRFPKKMEAMKNIIFYGPKGVGKYTQMLKSIKRYSPSELKYEKKITITHNKTSYFFKISDIHYEIDMSLLGCISKLLWHDIYLQLTDIISTKVDKCGIIVCKYFEKIHNELLDNFYSYMQKNSAVSVDLKYILITEELSFIPDNILNCCEVISISRPTKAQYNKCLEVKLPSTMDVSQIINIKNIHSSISELTSPHKIICDKILNVMINIDELKFMKFRDLLYDIFIYNLDITYCVWYILSSLITQQKITNEDMPNILIKMYSFFQYYNNNYRPIYHLESFFFTLISIIHKFPEHTKI